ncbi:tail protein X [Brevibacillus panacihumi]|uniref:Phage tail protein n=1 Tax=Brevibacillus panacihumi TaxID=497735 RepID=A0A3M8C993_9BACL|nr:tail protein X [Brevibacillus panacihumi]RNB72179.1 phage tail protein [Brevibacillus panacihumi]
MRTYTTIQGDMWDLIAYKMLGSEYYMTDLIDANPDHRDTVIFPANVELIIPDVDTVQTPNTLPPWKRGEVT